MSVTVIQSLMVTQYNRLDVGFFIALQSVQARHAEIVRTIPEAEILRRLALLTPHEKAPCLVLACGQRGPSALPSIEKEYPFLAWALIEPTLEAMYQAEAHKLKALKARLHDIQKWQRPGTRVAGPSSNKRGVVR